MDKWKGRVALVTGASVGIGAATVRLLLKHGMKVVGCARSVEKVQDIGKEPDIKDAPGQLMAVKCDLSKEEEILSMFREIEKNFGGVDVCVNNAGCGFIDSLLEGSTEQWRTMLDVNVMALCICTREAVKSMKARGVDDGHIINVSSLSGHRLPSVTGSFYGATKYAVRALTEGMRREMRQNKSNIRISQLSPGLVETEFQYRAQPDRNTAEKIYKRFKHCLQADDMANSIVYMLSAPPHVEVHDVLVRPTEQAS